MNNLWDAKNEEIQRPSVDFSHTALPSVFLPPLLKSVVLNRECHASIRNALKFSKRTRDFLSSID